MIKLRLNPWRNLGCIGIYGPCRGGDIFLRPYLGIFLYGPTIGRVRIPLRDFAALVAVVGAVVAVFALFT